MSSSKKIMKKIIPSILHIKKGPKQQHRPTLWQWHWRPSSCNHRPETLSFRCPHNHNDNDNDAANYIIFKTHNSIFLHPAYQDHSLPPVPDFCLTLTSSSNSDIDHNYNNNTDIVSSSSFSSSSSSSSPSSSLSVETIIRGAVKASNRDRLFFEPEPGRTSSILLLKEEEEEEAAAAAAAQGVDEQEEEEEDLAVSPLPFKESVALALESEDPYRDFKESMREMVESQGLKKKNEQEQGWESLEELLGWYLRMNNRMNHGIIVGAFVDLLLGLAKPDDDHHNNNNIRRSSSTSTSTASSYSSADSCFSSPRSVVTGEDHHIQ